MPADPPAPPGPRQTADDPLAELGQPRGTLAVVGIFGVLFALGWLAMYVYLFLERGAPHH